jgi:hypothetical protein
MAVRSKALVCDSSLAGIVGSNPAGGTDVCLLCYVVRYRSLRWADHSSRGELWCVIVCDLETSRMSSWLHVGPQRHK